MNNLNLWHTAHLFEVYFLINTGANFCMTTSWRYILLQNNFPANERLIIACITNLYQKEFMLLVQIHFGHVM